MKKMGNYQKLMKNMNLKKMNQMILIFKLINNLKKKPSNKIKKKNKIIHRKIKWKIKKIIIMILIQMRIKKTSKIQIMIIKLI